MRKFTTFITFIHSRTPYVSYVATGRKDRVCSDWFIQHCSCGSEKTFHFGGWTDCRGHATQEIHAHRSLGQHSPPAAGAHHTTHHHTHHHTHHNTHQHTHHTTHHQQQQQKARGKCGPPQLKRLPPSPQGAAKKRSALGDITNNKEEVDDEVARRQARKGASRRCAGDVIAESVSSRVKWIASDLLCSPPARPNAVTAEEGAVEEVAEEEEEEEEVVVLESKEVVKTVKVVEVVVVEEEEESKEVEVVKVEEEEEEEEEEADSSEEVVGEVGVEEEPGKGDPLQCSEYARSVFLYMKQREEKFSLLPYMERQADLNAEMRGILVDWMVEVQENFQLNHETLYLAVKLVDHFLNVAAVPRENLQLVGATCVFIAAKFDEVCPPSVDDLLFICDDAYTHVELVGTERRILLALDYDVNIPVAYRPLRRYAKVCGVDMKTLTLARYACESTLAHVDFVSEGASRLAAACLGLALRMMRLPPWPEALARHSGYQEAGVRPLMARLNELLRQAPEEKLVAVYSKYSHKVFFEVAKIPPLAPEELK
ncbi:G2/mitotic-specific cyclin-B3 [Petromyzon marinus]|uniref:G2/mitotic-specific cyclin-B3 n=1 Tax=Petromyzon marinus TaxID=7757 RepID=UPI003F724BF9